ncbi:DUF1772 domain-containing protein [Pigmentibacter sp. JX0631]|uniref:DUF1772 domain-containing protein n=1 Tax=Pigmentibacter sp. JX0631 TaxID=2976982 RepID=UPI0024697987|nr:DUF1772 domain-containing protein [Pigmentibacter sp. JX0631]WGL59932.1 DUF1772 domain-containing protein [Pigmentibacter sp. JX0631]
MIYKFYCLAHIASGIYAGACLSISLIDLRFVQDLGDNALKNQYFTILLKNMGIVMGPLLVLMLVLFLFLTYQKRKNLNSFYPLIVLITILVITVTIHFPINDKFFNLTVPEKDVNYLITKWMYWHYLRTLLAFILPYFIVKYFKQNISKSEN